MARPAETMIELVRNLEATAEWRREKALEYPNDPRNVEAAELLERLVRECLDTDESQQGEHVTAFVQQCSSHEWGYIELESLNDYLKGIGFHDWPDNPEALCQGILNALGVSESEVV
jgi:hypothetical protein